MQSVDLFVQQPQNYYSKKYYTATIRYEIIERV